MGSATSSITSCVLPNNSGNHSKRRKGSAQSRRRSTFLLKNSMTDTLDLEAIKWVSNITFFINTQNEWLYKLHLFQKYSKYLKLYDTDRTASGGGNKVSSNTSITELLKDRSIKYSDLFKIHALVVDQSYTKNAELVSLLEGKCQNNGYRTCLLIRKSDALSVFAPDTPDMKGKKNSNCNINGVNMTNPRIYPADPANPIHPGQYVNKPNSVSPAADAPHVAVDTANEKAIDFSVFDHVILLNDDDTAFNEAYLKSQNAVNSMPPSESKAAHKSESITNLLTSSQTIQFQIYQFLQNCQREALARYALSLSNDYFLRLKADDLTLLDTNTTLFAELVGQKIPLNTQIVMQLQQQVASTQNDCQSALEQGIKADIMLCGESYNCRIWMADEGIDNDYIVRIRHGDGSHQTTPGSRRSSIHSDANNNRVKVPDDCAASPSDIDTAYRQTRNSSRRRSSLAQLRSKITQKSPVNEIVRRIDEVKERLKNEPANDAEQQTEMLELFDTVTSFLAKVEPELAAKVNPNALNDHQNADLASAMLNKSSSKTSDQVGPSPSDSATRRSSTIRQLQNRSIIKNSRTTHAKQSYTSLVHDPDRLSSIQQSNESETASSPHATIQEAFHSGAAIPVQDPDYPLISADLQITYPITPNISPAAQASIDAELARHATAWEFNCFKVEQLSHNTTLEKLGMELFKRFNVFEILQTDERTALNWLKLIQANYRKTNSYHNSTHAADVMQATATFLMSARCSQLMSGMDKVACLLAAAVHDVDHRGKTNQYLSNSLDPLAVLYNDKAVLENHHAATAFRLTLEVDESFNIFKNMEESEFKNFRAIVIEMVLATEMSQHFGIVNKFINLASQDQTWKENANNLATVTSGNGLNADSSVVCRRSSDFIDPAKTDENHKLLISLARQMIIKVSDISNPVRPIETCVIWTKRICEEYFEQTEDEQNKGLPVVMPSFDRKTCSVPKSQIFFIDYFVRDMVDAWSDFINDDKLMRYLDDNQAFWRRLESRGSKSIQDLLDHQTEEMQKCQYLRKVPDSSTTALSTMM